MADTIIAGRLTLDAGDANQSVKSFKTQLREASDELVNIQKQFGATSKEALAAAKRVAEMKDQMKEANEVADLFDPGAKFQAFGNVVRTVAGGFTALTGTMALFGAESQDVEKALLKVQAALAITEGVNTIVDSAKDFTRLKAIIGQTSVVQKTLTASTMLTTAVFRTFGLTVNATSVGFKVLRGAIIATGIGALVVGLGMIIANFDTIKKVIMNLFPGLEKLGKFFGKLIDTVTDFVGATSEAGRQLDKTIKGIEKSIKDSEQFLDLNADKYDQYTQRKIKADLDYKKKKVEFLKDDTLTEAQKTNLITQAEAQRTRAILSASADRAKAAKKVEDDANKILSDKAKQLADQRIQAEQQASAQLRTIKQENYLASISDERKRAEEKLRIDFENATQQIKGLKISGDIKEALLKEQEIKFRIAVKGVKAEFDLKDAEDAKKKADEAEKAKAEEYARQLALIKEHELNIQNALKEDVLEGTVSPEDALEKSLEIQRTALQAEFDLTAEFGYSTNELKAQLLDADLAKQKEAADQELAIDRAKKASKLDFYAAIGDGFGALSNLLGQSTKAGKVAALAEIAINTGVGYMKGLLIAQDAAKATGPLGAFTFPIFYATQIAAVLGAAARAKSILSSGGGGSGSAPSMPSAPTIAPLRPEPPRETSTRLPQEQINQLGSAAQPVRAFVVESDVTNNQERITRLSRAARLGG